MSINERTLKDATYEESYYRSMFYIRSVEKVELRKQAVLVYTRNLGPPTPTYLPQHPANTLPKDYDPTEMQACTNLRRLSRAPTSFTGGWTSGGSWRAVANPSLWHGS